MHRDILAGVLLLGLIAYGGSLGVEQLDGLTWSTLWWVGASCFVFGYAVATGRHIATIDEVYGTEWRRDVSRVDVKPWHGREEM